MRKTFSRGMEFSRVLVPAVALVAALALAGAAEAQTTYYVNQSATAGAQDGSDWDNGFLTMQAAIDAADLAGAGAAPFTVYVTSGAYADTDGSFVNTTVDDIHIFGGYLGVGTPGPRDIVAYETILEGAGDATAPDRMVYLENVSTVELDGLTIAGGYCNDNNGSNYGGAGIFMHNVDDTSVVSNCTIRDNTVMHPATSVRSYGGGVYMWDASPTFYNCLITGNEVNGPQNNSGGGVYMLNRCNGAFTSCTITANHSESTANNRAGWGGGISMNFSSGLWDSGERMVPELTSCVITYNTVLSPATQDASRHAAGGGVVHSNAAPIITDCEIAYNTVTRPSSASGGRAIGGGIYGAGKGSQPIYTNCRIHHNECVTGADADGGGFYNSPQSIGGCTMTLTQIYNNRLTYTGTGAPHLYGAGLHTRGDGANRYDWLIDCEIRDNVITGAGNSSSVMQGAGLHTYNDVILDGCTISGNEILYTGAARPNLYGGAFFIDSGESIIRDSTFDGNRIETPGANNVWGAGGFAQGQNPLLVENCDFINNEVLHSGAEKIEDIYSAGLALAGTNIGEITSSTFNANLSHSEGDSDGPKFFGTGFYAQSNGTDLTFTGCRFSGNHAWMDGSAAASVYGVGAYAENGSFTFDTCEFNNNVTTATLRWTQHEGGGLHVSCNSGGSRPVTLTDCVANGNVMEYLDSSGPAHLGTGVYLQYGPATITGCDFSNNSIEHQGNDNDEAQGAGLYANFGSPSRELTITDTTITNNSILYSGSQEPQREGAGLYAFQCSPNLTNVTISNNTITVSGGGSARNAAGGGAYLYVNDVTAPCVLTDCLISGNRVENTTTSWQDVIGGGLFVEQCALAMTGTTVSNNELAHGGGRPNMQGAGAFFQTMPNGFSIDDCDFTGNSISYTNTDEAQCQGGGLLISGTVIGEIVNSRIRQNVIESAGENGADVFGGGLYASSGVTSLTLNQCVVSENRLDNVATNGGLVRRGIGLYLASGKFHLVDTQVVDNTSESPQYSSCYGGGIGYVGPGDGSNPLLMDGCAVARNLVTYTGNVAPTISGGGLYVGGGACALTDCDFADNRIYHNGKQNVSAGAGNALGGGVYINLGAIGRVATLTDCLIDGNILEHDRDNISGGDAMPRMAGAGLYVQESSLDVSGCDITNNQMVLSGLAGQATDYFGGGVFLQTASSADFTGCAISGNEIVYTNDGQAFQYGAGVFIDGTVNATFTGCDIMNNLNDTASVNGGVSGAGLSVVSAGADVTLDGCEVSGNVASVSNTASGADVKGGGVRFEAGDLTLVNTAVDGNRALGDGLPGNQIYGAGLFCQNAASLLVGGSSISSNTLQYTGAEDPLLYGGGLYLENTPCEVTSTDIKDNVLTRGGEDIGHLYGAGAFLQTMPAGSFFTSCDFIGNLLQFTGSGAGVDMYGAGLSLSGTVATDFDSCDFCGNVNTATHPGTDARGGGVSILSPGHTGVFRDCVISGNSCLDSGGGLFASTPNSMETSLVNCIVSGNVTVGGGGKGAGIHNYRTNMNVINCAFVDNRNVSGAQAAGITLTHEVTTLTLVNNIFKDNLGGAAIYEVDESSGDWDSDPDVLANNLFHGTEPFYYDEQLDTGAYYTSAAVINATIPNASGNTEGDVLINVAASGQWTADATMPGNGNRTLLTDATAAFAPGSLVGLLIKPDVDNTPNDQPMHARITSNSATQIEVGGAIGSWIAGGDSYEIYTPQLLYPSAAIDAGTDTLSLGVPTEDILGTPRQDAIGPSIADVSATDIGPFEFAGAGIEVSPLSLDFGTTIVEINALSDGRAVQIDAVGVTDLDFTGAGLEFAGPNAADFDFAAAPSTTTVSVGDSLVVLVGFDPQTSGTPTNDATLLVTTTGGDEDIDLTGVGVPNTPPSFLADPIFAGVAQPGATFTTTLTDDVEDEGLAIGDILTYTEIGSGPAWLTIQSDGWLTGTPMPPDLGTNQWDVQVADLAGATDDATIEILVQPNPPGSVVRAWQRY